MKKRISVLVLVFCFFVTGVLPLSVFADEETGKITGTFMFPSENKKSKENPELLRDFEATYYYDDDYFTNAATEYNPSLSTMSLCFAMSAFASNIDNTRSYENKPRNAKQLLTDLKFSDIEVNDAYTEKPDTDTLGVIAAHKTIIDNGTPYTLIALGARGYGYEAEWASNLTIGASDNHRGFSEASEVAHGFLTEYINKHKSELQENIKIWITGYSRSAAAVNLLAARLDDDKQIADFTLEKDNIYAYCFEPPMGADEEKITNPDDYGNIHNIANPNDLVTKVAPDDWSFTRYGVDERVIPSKLTSANVELYKKMLEKFKALNTDGTNEALVENGTKHIIDTFQAKKINLGFTADWKYGHWTERKSKYSDTYYVYGMNNDKESDIIVDDTKEMGAFLDDLILCLAMGLKDRENYTDKLQDAVRLLISVFMGNSIGAAKTDKISDEFIKILNEQKADILMAYITGGSDSSEKLVTDALFEAIEKEGIDISSLGSISGAFKEAVKSIVRIVISSILISGGNDLITLVYNADKLLYAHAGELCLAWLQMQDENYTPDAERLDITDAYRVVRISGEADADVIDRNGEIVAQFVDNKVQNSDSMIIAAISDSGEKTVYLPTDMDYTVNITALSDGELNYSVSEFSYEASGYVRLVNYNDIPVAAGDILTGDVDMFEPGETKHTSLGSERNYSLSDKDGELIPGLSVSAKDGDIPVYAVTCRSDNIYGGIALGNGMFVKDSFAKLKAVPYENCTFEGWYENDSLVSSDTDYRFRVTSDTHLTARFTGTRPTPGNGAALLNITAGKGGKVNTDINGYYTPGSIVNVSAAADSGYVFDGWTSSGGGTFENEKSADTVFYMPDGEVEITASFRKKSSGGGGGSVSSYTVKFDSNGGSEVASQKIVSGRTVTEPIPPVKDGYDFKGWYTDKELTLSYDFNSKVTKSFTLYAKWEASKKPEFILTIGKKEANVWGEIKVNDVAPIIRNDRTMLPARFIAENLGAVVDWKETGVNQGIVTITNDDVTIVITVDSDIAYVNGKAVTLDSPAFIENDRTYTPLRFIAENLGAVVEWNEQTQEVIITRK